MRDPVSIILTFLRTCCQDIIRLTFQNLHKIMLTFLLFRSMMKRVNTDPEEATMAEQEVNKSAVTGRFVSEKELKRNPRETYKQTVRKKTTRKTSSRGR
jgi:hypothetical protein